MKIDNFLWGGDRLVKAAPHRGVGLAMGGRPSQPTAAPPSQGPPKNDMICGPKNGGATIFSCGTEIGKWGVTHFRILKGNPEMGATIF